MACYRKANGTTISDTSSVDGACGIITTANLYSPCCPIKSNYLGTGNLCLSDYLCWESSPPAGGTGYLTASCTDETYASGECTAHCADNPVPDVIYNPDTRLWACCSWTYEGGVDCANPTSETFEAPAPQALLNAASASSSIPASTATSSTGIQVPSSIATVSAQTKTTLASQTTSSSTTSPTSSSSASSSGLSSEAKAGIGIGIAALVVGLLVILGFFFVVRKRRGQRGGVPPHMYNSEMGEGEKYNYKDKSPAAVELPEHQFGGRGSQLHEAPSNVYGDGRFNPRAVEIR